MPQFESTRKPNGAVSARVVTGSQVSVPDYGGSDEEEGGTPLPNDFPKVDRLTEAGYSTLEDVEAATDEELLSVDRIGQQSVDDIRAAVEELL